MTEESAPKAAAAAGVVYQLKHPVEIGPLRVTSLTFPDRLKGRHVRRYAASERGIIDADTLLRVAADASGQPDRVFDEMDAEDSSAIVELMTGFFVKAGFLRAIPAS